MVRMPATHGAALTSRSQDGDTAYTEAMRQHRNDIAAFLLWAGVQPPPAPVVPPLPVGPSASVA